MYKFKGRIKAEATLCNYTGWFSNRVFYEPIIGPRMIVDINKLSPIWKATGFRKIDRYSCQHFLLQILTIIIYRWLKSKRHCQSIVP